MGKPNSKTSSQEGTTNININEHLENNSLYHESHDIKLWIILVVNILQILWILRKIMKKKWRREGFNRARVLSRENLEEVIVDK